MFFSGDLMYFSGRNIFGEFNVFFGTKNVHVFNLLVAHKTHLKSPFNHRSLIDLLFGFL